MPRERALACAIRLLDLGFFRIGSGPDDVLVFRGKDGSWHDVRSEDFRTWHGTVLAAVELARGSTLLKRQGRERDPRCDQARRRAPWQYPEGTITPRQQSLIERRVLELIE